MALRCRVRFRQRRHGGGVPWLQHGMATTFLQMLCPKLARLQLSEASISDGGWMANYRAPEIFARYKVTGVLRTVEYR